ncbi:MAG: right-handed parallel beta-helix repeat-containing protein [Saprospiraceae bacterium]|nr:right-handed parallel beta-helix repeat-containing protein [Saprospiraceae bacterium]
MNILHILPICLLLSHCMTSQKGQTQSVKKYGAKGNGLHDDTEAIQAAIDKNETVFLPKGVYLVNHLVVGDNKRIYTEGYETVLKQNPNHARLAHYDVDKSLIWVKGSYVFLDYLTCEGNIEAYGGEQNHAVLLLPDTKNISNVHIKGLKIKNMRGDGLCIGNTHFFCSDIKAENLTIQNVYRNGVSVTSGHDILLSNIDVRQSGLGGIDLEGEGNTDMPFENIQIEKALVGNLSVSGMNQKLTNVTIKDVHIDGTLKGSTPSYKYMNPSGIIIEKAENVQFTDIILENLPEFAIYAGDVDTKQAFLSRNIIFNNVKIRKSSLTETRYNAYICVMGFTDLTLNNLTADLEKDKTLFLGKTETFKGTQQVILNKAEVRGGKNLAQRCQLVGKNLVIDTEGGCLTEMTAPSIVEDSDIKCQRLTDKVADKPKTKIPASYSTQKRSLTVDKTDFKNCTVVERE